jgi:hypothetical protein
MFFTKSKEFNLFFDSAHYLSIQQVFMFYFLSINLRNFMKFGLFFILLIFFISCKSTQDASRKLLPALKSPKVTMIQNGDSFKLIFVLQSYKKEGMDIYKFVSSVRDVNLIRKSRKGGIIDTIHFPIPELSGVSGSAEGASLALMTTADFKSPDNFHPADLSYYFLMEGYSDDYFWETAYDSIFINSTYEKPILELESRVEGITDSSAYFVCYVTRITKAEKQYFGSSELLRAVISDEKGRVMWNSDAGQNYLQMIYPVLPEREGDTHKYSVFWNGVKKDGTPLPPGLYQVRLTLLTKPKPFESFVHFYWKQRHD